MLHQLKSISSFFSNLSSRVARNLQPHHLAGIFVLVLATFAIIGIVINSKPTQNTSTLTESNSSSTSTLSKNTSKNNKNPADSNPSGSPSGSPSLSKPALTSPPPAPTPGSVLNLTNWKLTLPIDTPRNGRPDEVKQPELASFSISPYFFLNSSQNGIIFRAYANGVTTSGSSYPRSELREMTNSGNQSASWSNSNGVHTMTIKQAITNLPSVKPQVVAAQIHDSSDDVIQIRLENKSLMVMFNDGKSRVELDSNYVLGTSYTVKITASDSRVKVSYNGVQKFDEGISGSNWYFKAGCYTQSNSSQGDSPSAYGEVIIYDLQLSHS